MSDATWCWYTEGGSFYGGFLTREAAIAGAYAYDSDRLGFYVGTETDPMDEVVWFTDAANVAENIDLNINVEGCRVTLCPGAQEALEAWAREYLSFDSGSICLDGERPAAEEWARAAGGSDV